MARTLTLRTRAMLLIAVLLGSTVIVIGTGQVPAGADPLCTVTNQVTSTTGGLTFTPSISGDGTRIAFSSDRDIGGGNPDLNLEIFLHDATGPSTIPVTSTTGGLLSNTGPSISADGTRIAFVSTRDLTGGNPDLNSEIFVHDTTGPLTIQVTSTTGGFTGRPSISADGTRIAFASERDIGGGNPDGNQEVFLHDTTGPLTTQITSTTSGGNDVWSISADGTRIAFSSNHNFGGGNPDGNFEVFVHDTTGPSTIEVTSTTGGGNFFPSISADGTRIAFRSDRNIGGGNADLNEEVFVHDTTAPSTAQVTSTTGGSNDVRSISGDGTRIAFTSDRDIGGGNPDLNREVFVHDTATSSTTQVTSTTGPSNESPSISVDGTRVAFHSNRNISGGNPDANFEVFRGACGSSTPSFSDVSTSNVFFDQIEWMVAAGVASGFPNGTFAPQDPVKRQQMANFMYNLAGRPAFTPPSNANRSFTDYPVGSTFYAEVEWMAAEGVASGFPDGTFRPQDPVKRQQMANFLYNLAGEPFFLPPVAPTFTDYPPGSTFYPEVEWMAAEQIASGFPDGTFRPQDPVKRQQMANFMYNFAAGVGVGV